MTPYLTVIGLLTGGLIASALWYAERARTHAAARLGALIGGADAVQPVDELRQRAGTQTFPQRYRWLAVAEGVVVLIAVRVLAALPIEVAIAVACLTGVLAHLTEEYVAEQRTSRIEAQLSDTIDLLVGALRAGSSLLAALEASLKESRAPLRPYLQYIVNRIRLGDDPRLVLADLPRQVPLETFRLFGAALAVHWEVGGSLASTLATIGRTIRDRIEVARRVRAQGVEATASVAAVLLIAYVLGFLMWRTTPERMEAFVRSAVGTELVSLVIGLQAIGLIWMARLSRSEF
jgi:tight adherence protein B